MSYNETNKSTKDGDGISMHFLDPTMLTMISFMSSSIGVQAEEGRIYPPLNPDKPYLLTDQEKKDEMCWYGFNPYFIGGD